MKNMLGEEFDALMNIYPYQRRLLRNLKMGREGYPT
jgi:hypothetical protein